MKIIKKLFVIIAILNMNYVYGQYCTNDIRFTEIPVFTDSEIDSFINVIYATAPDWQGVSQDLRFDIYFPNQSIDTLIKRPFILLIHGGAFIAGNKEDWGFECKEFAKRGFVAATMNYRLGLDCLSDSLSYDKAVYRAQQDANAFLRYAVNNASVVGIDTAWMFIGGSSAGAGTSLNLVYLQQNEWDIIKPSIHSLLGSLDSSGNSLTNIFALKGIYDNWGGTVGEFINTNEMLPMISFHGDADSSVNIDSAIGKSCVNPAMIYGSRGIHNLLINEGVCSDITVVTGAGHGVFFNTDNEKLFRVNKATCFFKSLFCNTCSSFYSTDTIPANCGATLGLHESDIYDENYLLQNYPNPFNSTTEISYYIPNLNIVTIKVYNLMGQEVQTLINKYQKTGRYSVDFNANNLSSGIYYYKLKIGNNYSKTKKMILIH